MIFSLKTYGDCREFVANSFVQNYLTTIWNGSVLKKSNFISLFKIGFSLATLGVLAPFIAYETKTSIYVE
jgi:hypothetical protein